MTDFQFDPGATNDPEENLHPYTMKPQTHGALDIHVLQISGQPMPAGAAMPVPKGPELTKPTLHTGEPTQVVPGVGPNHDLVVYKTPEGGKVEYAYTKNGEPYEAYHVPPEGMILFKTPDEINFPPHPFLVSKPVLHAEEPQSLPDYPQSMKAKTATGGSVWYDYTHDKKPLAATVYDQSGQFESFHNPSEIAFPAFKTPVKGSSALDQLDAEITKLLGPEKPTLHVGELSPTPETSPSMPAFKAKTPSGRSVYYYYNKDWTPNSADVYENATYVKTHNADEINFPLHPSLEQKPFAPTVHDTYSTAFAHYKNFDDDKPELEFAGPLIPHSSKNEASAELTNGSSVKIIYYAGGEPYKAIATKGEQTTELYPDEVNLPQHPSEALKPTLHVGELHNGPLGLKGETAEGNIIYYHYHNGVPAEAEEKTPSGAWIKSHDPKDINFPPHSGEKISLAKVNLPENYPKEEQIDELYNKPVYSRTPPNYPALNLKEPLTDEEYRVAREYSGTYYDDLARHIYHEGTSHVEKQDIETLTKAIDKHPLQGDMTLYRGVGEDVFNKFALLRPGQSGWQTGFMSTRTDRPGAENWKGGKYHFVIETPAGTPALPMETLSKNIGENEVLFKPNTKLQMVKREGRTLYLKVVQPQIEEQSLKYYSAYRTRDYTKDEFPWEYREYTEYAKKRFPGAFTSEQDFREKYIEAPLIHLPEDTLRNLENSTVGSYFHAGMEKARNDFSHHRDIDRIEGQMIAGSMPPPIVLKYSGGYRVLGGNTRLSVGAARGYNIPVKLIDISDKY